VHASLSSRFSAILHAASDVSRSIFFAAAIIIASFLPLFTLTGVEGHIFGPMAKTYAYAIAGGLVAAFTISPALSALLLPDRLEEVETWVTKRFRLAHEAALAWALANRRFAGGALVVLIGAATLSIGALGVEFLPHLEEGNLYIRASLPPSISLEAGETMTNQVRKIIAARPEVDKVVSTHGRPDDGTDPTGFFNAEFYAPLKPASQWPSGMTKEQMTGELQKAFAAKYPGVNFEFSQYIEDNVEEASSGVKGANSLKIFGPDLAVLTKLANQINAQMAQTRGVTDLHIASSLGQPTVRIDIDRLAAARYGLAPDDINQTVATAIGGQSSGNLYEQTTDRYFPIVVRLNADQRGDLDAISRITIGAPAPNGSGTSGAHRLGFGRVLHLSRTSGTLCPHQLQRARPRSWQHGGRSARAHCPQCQTAQWL